MRLVAVCVALFLAPAGCLIMTDRVVSAIESDFQDDAAYQVKRLDRIAEMYPPKVARLRNAAAILQLKRVGDGGEVASLVCGPHDGPYQHLFDRLSVRCGQWALMKQARWTALLAVAATLGMLALILMARITVKRYEAQQGWVGNWSIWFAVRGIQLTLAAQVVISLIGFAILLKPMVPRAVYAYAGLLVPAVGLLWVENRTVRSFVQPEKLKKHTARAHRRPPRRETV